MYYFIVSDTINLYHIDALYIHIFYALSLSHTHQGLRPNSDPKLMTTLLFGTGCGWTQPKLNQLPSLLATYLQCGLTSPTLPNRLSSNMFVPLMWATRTDQTRSYFYTR